MLFFSESVQGFYDKTLHNSIPEDALEVGKSVYKELLVGRNSGKLIKIIDGVPTLIDKPALSNNSPNSEKAWRDSELQRVDVELYKVQDSDPKSIGTVAQWREYRKALRSWPENEHFPSKEFRPEAPDA